MSEGFESAVMSALESLEQGTISVQDAYYLICEASPQEEVEDIQEEYDVESAEPVPIGQDEFFFV